MTVCPKCSSRAIGGPRHIPDSNRLAYHCNRCGYTEERRAHDDGGGFAKLATDLMANLRRVPGSSGG